MSAGKTSVDSNFIAEILYAAKSLAEAVGPQWGLVFLVVILLFLPKLGVVPHLASLWKEDRADARTRHVETIRLKERLSGRSGKSKSSKAKLKKQRRLK